MYYILFCERARGERYEVDGGRVLLNLHSSIAIVLFIFIGDHEMKRIQIQLFLVNGIVDIVLIGMPVSSRYFSYNVATAVTDFLSLLKRPELCLSDSRHVCELRKCINMSLLMT